MRWLIHHPKPLALSGMLILAVLFFGLESRGDAWSGGGMLDVLGGRLPQKAAIELERINAEIMAAKAILQAETGVIRILDAQDQVRRFAYQNGTLWADGRPVLLNLNRFHFEFRDEYGNLLTHSNTRRSEIKTVIYMLNLGQASRRILGSARIPLAPSPEAMQLARF